MRQNIPAELKQLPHWVVAGLDKVPLNPRTGYPASPTDPATWATFEEACRTGMLYIGLVLTESDPYTIIDLDNKPEKPLTPEQWAVHQKILEAFQSYTERSASGRGYHIIVRGKIPSGVKRDSVEAYSTARYMICTGDVVRNLPIVDQQALLDVLYGEMKPAEMVELEDHDSVMTDERLYEIALGAANGDKFAQLWQGDWSTMGYPSQSEADFALLSIIAYYTLDNEQVRRVFRYSGLGKRDKAQKNDRYLNYALTKIRAQQAPLVDLSRFDTTITPLPTPQPPQVLPEAREEATPISGVTLPPGLVGEVAQYIYESSYRPVPEIALSAAIALVAGICGRSYNISSNGLNQYIVLLAKTGTGKEGAATGIDNMMAAVRPHVPMIDQFTGPGAFASGQGLLRVLNEKPCFVSVLGEFGLTLQELSARHLNSAQVMLKKVILDIYMKSGWNKILHPSAYSDATKNTKPVHAPNVTLLGESTPETFYDGLEASHIIEGLIPRFLIIEYTGQRPSLNEAAGRPPAPELTARFADFVATSLVRANNGNCTNVQVDAEAQSRLRKLNLDIDEHINGPAGVTQVDRELLSRVHLKTLKLAALVAVGVNWHNPVMTVEMVEWAMRLVTRDYASMSARFKAGETGQGEHRQEGDMRRAINLYLEMDQYTREKSWGTPKAISGKQLIPFHYLRRRCRLLAAFKNDRRGSAKAIEECLKDMVKAEILQLIPPIQTRTEFKLQSDVYTLGSNWNVG